MSSLAQSAITGDSGLGNALRGVPLIGGFFGAAGDILSGVANIGLGALTFNGGEIASGFSELGGGVGSVIQIGFTDIAATLIGAGAYAYNNVRNAISVATFGNVFGNGNVLDSLKNLAWTAAIPDYAFNGGPMWSNPSSSLNYVDSISISHDIAFGQGQPNASANWVGAGWSSLPSGQIAPGPAGIGYVLLGSIPILISNAVLGH
jgi:hypothetical protein